MTFRIYRTVTCDRLDEQKPILLFEIENNVREFAMAVKLQAQRFKRLLVKMYHFVASIANV